MSQETKKGYVSMEVAKKTHYVPEDGRRHILTLKCWCHPIDDKKNQSIHHHPSDTNNAKCEGMK